MSSVTTIILIVLFILVAIIYVVFFFFPNNLSARLPTELIIQNGASAATDTMATGGNNLYISNTNIPNGFNLQLSANDSNVVGKVYYIKNNSITNAINITTASGVQYTAAPGVSSTIAPGALATLVITVTSNSFYRID